MTALTDQAQAVQGALADMATRDLAGLWDILQVDDATGTLPKFVAAVTALVQHYSLAAATASEDFYQSQRQAAKITGRYTPVQAPLPGLPEVDAAVRWATHDLWTPPESTPGTAGVVASPTGGATVVDLSAVHTLTAGVVDKMVLDTGRDTVLENVARDRKARGWARVPEPGCCSFCALLATREALYKRDSFDQSDRQYRERLGRAFADHPITASTVKTHDHCRCHMEPVFNIYEPSAQIREWQAMYRRVPHGPAAQMRNDFRRIYEGRAAA